MVERIISGGQTGADQGALEAAARLGIPTGGFMPAGHLTEDGPRPDLAEKYGLEETAESGYSRRTERNVLLGDGTVIFAVGDSPGSRLTARLCRRHRRPCLEVPPDVPDADAAVRLRTWLHEHEVRVLNVAGSRERGALGIGARVALVLELALAPDGEA